MKNCFSAVVFMVMAVVGVQAELEVESANNIDWYDAAQLGIRAKGWSDTPTHYTRLPTKAREKVPKAVWSLAQHSAGIFVRFRTDATAIQAVHHVTGTLSMPHMTTIGSSGLDLYAKDTQNLWRWVGISRPNANCYTNMLISGIEKTVRDYTLYLPLYNHTATLKVGVPAGSLFETLPSDTTKPVVYYGTSIAHGCSASRPGMVYTAILGRRLDRTFINLGFSGNGRMEPAMADLLAEIDAAVYVLDCLPNMSGKIVEQRVEPFVRSLRAARPDTPIVMVGSRPFTNSWIKPDGSTAKNEVYRDSYKRLLGDNINLLTLVDGTSLFGDDAEGTVDGSHPSDLGMWRQADILEPVLRSLLRGR